jgi:hypothetical protein
MERRKTRLGSKKAPFGRSIAATSSALGPDFRAQARASSPSRQVSPPFTCLVQPLKAAPRSGHGRLPKAPRVCVCETQPRAPHRPSGCPSGQLSLCPTSGSPLEAPLTGQDASRISEVLGAGIGIHSHLRERRLLVIPGCARPNSGLPEFGIIIVQVGNSRLGWRRPGIQLRTLFWIPGSPVAYQ